MLACAMAYMPELTPTQVGGGTPSGDGFWLMEDGASFFLMEDGISKWLLE